MLSADPVLQESRRRNIAKCGVAAFPVVERLDIVEQVGDRLGPRAVAGAMHPLVLQAIEEALRWRVVPAVSFATHRAGHLVLIEPRLKGVARVL